MASLPSPSRASSWEAFFFAATKSHNPRCARELTCSSRAHNILATPGAGSQERADALATAALSRPRLTPAPRHPGTADFPAGRTASAKSHMQSPAAYAAEVKLVVTELASAALEDQPADPVVFMYEQLLARKVRTQFAW